MAKNNNLTDFLTGIADTIRTQKNTSALINPQDFESEISGLTDVSDTTAVAGDVLSGKDFYLADGTKSTGTIQSMAGGTKTSNTTLATSGKYLTSDVIIRVNASNYIYRHLNPTIIRIDLRSVTMPYTLKLYFRQGDNGVSSYINWGDGSSPTSVSASFSDYKSHQYTTQAIYTIVVSPQSQNNNRFLLNNSAEQNDMITFNEYMFGQSSNSHFTIPISIYCGDSAWFRPNSLSYCDNIEVLDFTNMNSLMEQQVTSNNKYFTQDLLAANMCRHSNISTLIIGSGVNRLGGGCFNGTTVFNIIVIDARGTGISTATITLDDNYSLPTTINGKILIKEFRLNAYKSASRWAAKSSIMYAY